MIQHIDAYCIQAAAYTAKRDSSCVKVEVPLLGSGAKTTLVTLGLCFFTLGSVESVAVVEAMLEEL